VNGRVAALALGVLLTPPVLALRASPFTEPSGLRMERLWRELPAAYAAANPGRRGLAVEPGDPFTRL
jgi:hypothetical protein